MEREARGILQNVHSHNPAYGGHFLEVTAGTGKGKTAMLLSTAKYNLATFPKEKTFFSECFDTPLQTLKLGKEYVHFLIPEKHKNSIVFRDREKHLQIVPHEFFDITYFKDGDYQDLYNKAKYNMVNVVIFPERREVMSCLSFFRSIGEFITYLIDEMSEIATSFGTDMFHVNEKFAFVAKDFRKCLMNVWYCAQATNQVDYRLCSVVDIKIFGPGARQDKISRITQNAIDNLAVDKKNGNEFWIGDSGTFGLFKLGDVFEPKEGLLIEAHIRQTS